MDRHRKVMGDYGDIDTIDDNFLRHINGIESQQTPAAPPCPILNTVDITKAVNYGICKLCHIAGNEETPYHILMECPYTWQGRAEALGAYDPDHRNLLGWEPARLVAFFTRYDVENLV